MNGHVQDRLREAFPAAFTGWFDNLEKEQIEQIIQDLPLSNPDGIQIELPVILDYLAKNPDGRNGAFAPLVIIYLDLNYNQEKEPNVIVNRLPSPLEEFGRETLAMSELPKTGYDFIRNFKLEIFLSLTTIQRNVILEWLEEACDWPEFEWQKNHIIKCTTAWMEAIRRVNETGV